MWRAPIKVQGINEYVNTCRLNRRDDSHVPLMYTTVCHANGFRLGFERSCRPETDAPSMPYAMPSLLFLLVSAKHSHADSSQQSPSNVKTNIHIVLPISQVLERSVSLSLPYYSISISKRNKCMLCIGTVHSYYIYVY